MYDKKCIRNPLCYDKTVILFVFSKPCFKRFEPWKKCNWFYVRFPKILL